ncbi:diacylglycerol kinase [Chelatococcus sp. SYSU_G07232]|uniref:Diacylglycerol kinase n=1 Tax=Chelatococcus albus TaxID=3047466 RepID=A0ABT7AKE3_9HYPH|nr:diacylglycerol kinase [Chelatococcus sp. SYSU_G07232]MDJ1159840.1 diacylglycerol kinase [Chelatococcus sp. SYSU_G07232]
MHEIVLALRNSLRGLVFAVRSERAVRQELVLLLLALPLAAVVTEKLWLRVGLVCTILLVLTAELLNTALEKLADHVTPEPHPRIGIVKDLGSAAVFCALILAALVWGAAVAERLGLL